MKVINFHAASSAAPQKTVRDIFRNTMKKKFASHTKMELRLMRRDG